MGARRGAAAARGGPLIPRAPVGLSVCRDRSETPRTIARRARLAIGFGSLISPRRWYWAAITAFVVFAGTQSRGDTLRKAAQRPGGTMAWVLFGIGAATAVSGQRDLALALILVCMFFAFYTFQAAYGVMIFWITNMIALLYGLLGYFKPAPATLHGAPRTAGGREGGGERESGRPASRR